MHLVLSMPEGTEPEAVRAAARQFCRRTYGDNHEYVFGLHTDERHPHCHVSVKCLGFDGRRLNPRKADLQAWREGFAEAMEEQGYEAEATPRRSRGVVRKAENSVVRHIERGDKTHAPRTSKVRGARVKEAAEALIAEAIGESVPAPPWEARIEARQHAVRSAWLAAARPLEQQPNAHNAELEQRASQAEKASIDDKALAARIQSFVASMPRIETQRDETRRNLLERFGQNRDAIQASSIQPLVSPSVPTQDKDAEL
jgi:type IV secretory pathway VirD2 relaxase